VNKNVFTVFVEGQVQKSCILLWNIVVPQAYVKKTVFYLGCWRPS